MCVNRLRYMSCTLQGGKHDNSLMQLQIFGCKHNKVDISSILCKGLNESDSKLYMNFEYCENTNIRTMLVYRPKQYGLTGSHSRRYKIIRALSFLFFFLVTIRFQNILHILEGNVGDVQVFNLNFSNFLKT